MAKPFFIVGAPRTGSTLLRRLLNNHSKLAIPPESGFLAEYLLADHLSLDKRKKIFIKEPEFDYWGVRPEWDDIYNLQSMIDCIRFMHEKYTQVNGKDFWGQKTPKLVRTGALWLDQMPDCRIIHMVRDPRAVVSSLRASKYHNLHIIQGSQRYLKDTRLGIELESNYGERVLRVSYEDLLTQPQRTLTSICDFIDLPFEEKLLSDDQLVKLTPNEQKFGHHQNVGGNLKHSFMEKWKKSLNSREIAIIESITSELQNELSYPYTNPQPPTEKELANARSHQRVHAIKHAWKELTQRPDFWRIAKRRWQLGNVRKMLTDHSKGM